MKLLATCCLLTVVMAACSSSNTESSRVPNVSFRKQASSASPFSYRELPVVTWPADPLGEKAVNDELVNRLGGATYTDVADFPTDLGFGSALTTCAPETMRTEKVLAFVCKTKSMGARPYYSTQGLAFDLRVGTVHLLTLTDIFTTTGLLSVRSLIGSRVKAACAADSKPLSGEPTIDSVEVYADHLEYTLDALGAATCGTVVRLTCADVAAFLSPTSPWTCPA